MKIYKNNKTVLEIKQELFFALWRQKIKSSDHSIVLWE